MTDQEDLELRISFHRVLAAAGILLAIAVTGWSWHRALTGGITAGSGLLGGLAFLGVIVSGIFGVLAGIGFLLDNSYRIKNWNPSFTIKLRRKEKIPKARVVEK